MTLYRFPGLMDFGPGSLGNLPQHLEALHVRRALVVTDQGLRKAGIVDEVERILAGGEATWTVFDRCEPNPSERDVEAAHQVYRDEECDGLVGLGGGSSMDTAKLVRVMARHGGEVLEYRSAAGGWGRIGADLPPMVAVPTTAGTGSEVTLGAVVTDSSRNVKVWVGSPGMFPDVALVDPLLTVGSPSGVTASAGIDVLVHGVEAYSETSEAPLADLLARDAIALTARHLPDAYDHPGEREPRVAMSRAAFQAGLAFGWKGLGAAHALGHQITTQAGVPHGLAVAMMLPHVMRFNLPVAADRYAELVPALGAGAHPDGDPDARAAIGAVEALNARLRVPRRLSEVGISKDRLPPMVEHALEDGTLPTNPRSCDADDLLEIYLEAL